MTPDPVLVLALLILAHLIADFVIQTDRIATDKFAAGRRAWRGLGWHVVGVAICLVPFVLAFGVAGLAVLIVVATSHGLIDRAKVIATRGVESRAEAESARRHERPAPAASLGVAWTPLPAALFAFDQLAHLTVLGAAWAIFLSQQPLTSAWSSAAQAAVGRWDQAAVHVVMTVGVVLVTLAIFNVRAASLFVAILVHPRQVVTGEPDPGADVQPGGDAAASTASLPSATGVPSAASPAVDAHPPTPVLATGPATGPSPAASAARIGATIGVLERLVIVALVLTGAEAAIGFVIAAKTLARFRQLDDRQFAEYYLLGTLASVTLALGSALIASAALAPLLGRP